MRIRLTRFATAMVYGNFGGERVGMYLGGSTGVVTLSGDLSGPSLSIGMQFRFKSSDN